MVHGLKLFALVFLGAIDHEHEGGWMGAFKVVGKAVIQNRGGKRTEPFTLLDAGVEDVLHFGVAGVGDDAAVAQSAGAPFHTTLEPSDDFTGCDGLGGLLEEIGILEKFGLEVTGVKGGFDGSVIIAGAGVGMDHTERARLVEDAVVHPVGGADGGAIIAGGGLDIDILKGGLFQGETVGDAVERDTAGEAKVVRAGF